MVNMAGTVAAPIFKNVAKRIFIKEGNEFQKNNQQNNNVRQNEPVQAVYASISNTGGMKTAAKVISDKNIISKHVMPDLIKLSGRDAIIVLSKLGIQYKVKGAGKVVTQSITPGEKLSGKSFCEICCDDYKITGAVIY